MSTLDTQRLQPWRENPWFWQWQAKPILLLGGSVEDNLFQIAELEAHLDLLQRRGGNYVRCTMSSRDPGDVWPFERDASGLYDLQQPGVAYWTRFSNFLRWTHERAIFVQIEIWDRFDFARAPWQDNPFNPKNNVNYTSAESGLPEAIETHPGVRENGFFHTVPALEDNAVVRPFQEAFVEQLLELSLPYGHVLYCIDNETNEDAAWPRYWAERLRETAGRAGRGVELTEMWDDHDLNHEQHRRTWEHPELYSFIDLSQNNHQCHAQHGRNLAAFRAQIAATGHIRPLNSVKVYGANTGFYGTDRDGAERFWRHLFGGVASVRFHRPASGLGLSEKAQRHLQSARIIADLPDFFELTPQPDCLQRNSANEAWCLAQPGRQFAVFFPDGGDLELGPLGQTGPWQLRWLDILENAWSRFESVDVTDSQTVSLTTPRADGWWVAHLRLEG